MYCGGSFGGGLEWGSGGVVGREMLLVKVAVVGEVVVQHCDVPDVDVHGGGREGEGGEKLAAIKVVGVG